ncbi:MAG: BREX-2 system adenine-specific DNA-methyltransferase PglX [Nocardiopsaceae bacterium]|nr:BREX-2 system adenine-specific DNA-methyltransferase PglX [Nocardiopsaceae bacterium]
MEGVVSGASVKLQLLKALQKQVALLEEDLRPRGLEDPRLKVEWRAARSAERTAATFETWLGERATQVAVAWVLSSVFVRFCEDNDLIEYPFITGPGDRDDLARDLQQKFYEARPDSDDRGWLEAAFAALSVSPVAAGLFDRKHNPMWAIPPSPHAVKGLLDFWRAKSPDGEIVYSFVDPEWNTRFLGDLYQDLSESARKTYALLQTPEFVEEFILKYTLDPALEEFGLTPGPWGYLRVIDPACGSGHFLLGAFRKLLSAWEDSAPAADKYDLVAKALRSVHGVDKNPFAVAVARFRLLLAAMRAAGVTRLTGQVDFPLNIAVGDSLLHGKGAPGRQGEFDIGNGPENHTYRTEDVDDYIASANILEAGSYHVVVANPPYITVKDKRENENYRKAYTTCAGKYALSVPFAERIFQLAIRDVGYTGQITANSFMKREFGRKLIEDYFAQKVDLTHVIDTSGAYIPGHGTPTVILVGRRRFPRSDATIRAVLGIRGEPGQPKDPADGLVWQAIVQQVDEPGSESEWVSSLDEQRDRFAGYPWSLSGGGAGNLMQAFDACSPLRSVIENRIGFYDITGNDDVYISERVPSSFGYSKTSWKRFATGEHIRDWVTGFDYVLWPYGDDLHAIMPLQQTPQFWPYRAALRTGLTFGKTREQRGLAWHEHTMLNHERARSSMLIAFSFVATHGQFTLDRASRVFDQNAPVIKLPESATEDDHLALLGVLNSSTACFWLKQVSYPKGGDPMGDEGARVSAESWSDRYEFTGTKLEQFPLPADLPLERGRELDALAQQLSAVEPSAVCTEDVPTRERLDAAWAEHVQIRGRMIALQEELDWDVYHRYGLISDEEKAVVVQEPLSVPEIDLGCRAFEIVLARRVEAGELETQWFHRHRSRPITEIPAEWPEEYRRVVAKRIEMIERNRNIGLIERPECKRRWQSDTWESKEQAALTTWLLDRCEDRSLWFDGDSPKPMTVNRLADRLRADADVVSVARLLKGQDADLADVLREIIDGEHVPFVAACRYKPSGMTKRRQWERTWDLQREEDRTGKRLDIPVPPKYASADFSKNSYWRHRGKLDVPKERFISYPDASPDSDSKSLLLGWAGWDHRQQAAALVELIEDRSSTDGWETDRLMGLLAGLQEVMPWVRQWHGEKDEDGTSWAEEYDGYLTTQREHRSLTEESLRTWRPSKPARGRRGRA